MFPPGWSIWCLLLILCTSACGLEIIDYDGKDVICEQGLSECTMTNDMPMLDPDDAMDVQNLMPKFKLCCKDTAACTLCLVIDIELYIHQDNNTGSEDHSGSDEEDYNDPKASVKICYRAAPTMPICKRVEFMVNHPQSNLAKMSMVINEPGIFYGTKVDVCSSNIHCKTRQEVLAPSLDEVCSQRQQRDTEDCYVPSISTVINNDTNQVELQFAGSNISSHSACAQYEKNGRCEVCVALNRMTIPLYSVTPCTCLQAWHKDNNTGRRNQSCPFTDSFEENLWQNVSVSVGQMNNWYNGTMLLWNLSAPCRLQGEVWPCQQTAGLTKDNCREIKGFRQQLANGTWRQNTKGHWEKIGVFEDIDLQLSPCVMMKVNEKGHQLGPFCYNVSAAGRWRWSLMVVALMLLICLTALLFYFLHDFVKKWVGSWHRRGFVEIGKKGHVVLLSPPDVDNGVPELVCGLGSLLCDKGFSVSVDQWSRKEQCTLGPLPWLHSQLLELNSLGGRVVLVVTRKALEKAEEWTHQHKEGDNCLLQMWSPYSDVFMASLSLIQGDKLKGRAGERFLLVKFDSFAVQAPSSYKRLPEPLQGLPLFQLPSQTQALLSELTVGGKKRGSGGRIQTV